jgi:hypothetical protein
LYYKVKIYKHVMIVSRLFFYSNGKKENTQCFESLLHSFCKKNRQRFDSIGDCLK